MPGSMGSVGKARTGGEMRVVCNCRLAWDEKWIFAGDLAGT